MPVLVALASAGLGGMKPRHLCPSCAWLVAQSATPVLMLLRHALPVTLPPTTAYTMLLVILAYAILGTTNLR